MLRDRPGAGGHVPADHRRAHRVTVLAHGRLVEIRPHAELLAAGGAYAALWAASTADEDADPLMD